MQKIIEGLRIAKKNIMPKNEKVLYLSIIISTTLSLFVSYCFYPRIFNNQMEYSDLVVGPTTWSGYYKDGDIGLFYVFLFCYIVLLILMPLLLNLVINKDDRNIVVENNKSYSELFLIAAVTVGTTIFAITKVLPLKIALIIGFFYLIYHLLKGKAELYTTSLFAKLCLLGIFAYCNIIVINIVVDIIFKGASLFSNENYNYMLISIILVIILLTIMLLRNKIKESSINILLALSQILLPSLFLIFYRFQYNYKGEIVSQYNSATLKYICLFTSVTLILYNLFIFYKKYINRNKDNNPIFISTTISLSAFFAYRLPEASLLTDYFHRGESVVPMHQLLEYGSLPYFDYIPVHGGYNYFFDLINYLLFNGEYATVSAAISISCVLLAIIVSILIVMFVKGDIFPFILSVLCANALGTYFDRWFGVFVMMLILYSYRMRRNPIKMLWWWVATSIFAIIWYPAIGGVISISFIPLIVHSFICSDKSELIAMLMDKSFRNKLVARWLPLFIVGCLYIPMFIKQVEYVIVTAKSNLEVFGNSATSAIIYSTVNFFGNQIANVGLTLIILPLGFILVVSLLLISSYKIKKKETEFILMIIQVMIFVVFAANYMYGRADSNLGRAISAIEVISITIIAAVINRMSKNIMYKPIILIMSIIIGIVFRGNIGNLLEQHSVINARPIIDIEYMRFDGIEEGIENLGIVYTSQEHIDILTDINYILKSNDSFLDFTNRSAYHFIFNKESPAPFSSIYVTLNYDMQMTYINAIENHLPEIILIYPNTVYDNATVAFRGYPIYKYIFEKGYSPYKYNDIVFLLSEDSPECILYERADEEFASIMHQKYLGFLPILWGNKDIINNRVENTKQVLTIVSRNQIEEIDGTEMIIGDDSFIIYQLDVPIYGLENDFIKVSLSSDYELNEEDEFQLFWADDNEMFDEEKSFVFWGDNGDLLIPVGTSPYWHFSDNIIRIRLDFPATMIGKTLPDVHLDIYRYSD